MEVRPLRPNALVIKESDNVAVTLEDIGKGDTVYLAGGREIPWGVGLSEAGCFLDMAIDAPAAASPRALRGEGPVTLLARDIPDILQDYFVPEPAQ